MHEEDRTDGPGDRPLVLIVDDDARLVALLHSLLEQFDCEVAEAFNGTEALKLATEISPHLILLDVAMPGMDGIEVLRRLKRDQATKDIPVLMLTGQTERSVIESAFGLGAVNYMLKPVARVNLVHAMTSTRTRSGYPLRLRDSDP